MTLAVMSAKTKPYVCDQLQHTTQLWDPGKGAHRSWLGRKIKREDKDDKCDKTFWGGIFMQGGGGRVQYLHFC